MSGSRTEVVAATLARSLAVDCRTDATDVARLALKAADEADHAAGVVRVFVVELCDFCVRESGWVRAKSGAGGTTE